MTPDPAIVDALSRTELFGSLSRRDLDQVARMTTVIRHPAGRSLTTQGDDGVSFHLILDGTASVVVNGRRVGELGPGATIGEIALIDGRPRSATITAVTDLTTAAMASWQFRPLLDKMPELARALLLMMCDRVRAGQARELVSA